MLGLIGPIGPLEIGIVLLIVLIIWGPRRLPELGKSLGSGMRNFKDSVTSDDDDDDDAQPAAITPPKTDAEVPVPQPTGTQPVPAQPPAPAGDESRTRDDS